MLGAIHVGNRDGLGLLAWDMIRHMLLALALLNERPYTTFARFVTEARDLPHQPARFEELLDLFVDGRLGDTDTLQGLIVDVVDRLEAMYDERRIPLGEGDLDRLKPADA